MTDITSGEIVQIIQDLVRQKHELLAANERLATVLTLITDHFPPCPDHGQGCPCHIPDLAIRRGWKAAAHPIDCNVLMAVICRQTGPQLFLAEAIKEVTSDQTLYLMRELDAVTGDLRLWLEHYEEEKAVASEVPVAEAVM